MYDDYIAQMRAENPVTNDPQLQSYRTNSIADSSSYGALQASDPFNFAQGSAYAEQAASLEAQNQNDAYIKYQTQQNDAFEKSLDSTGTTQTATAPSYGKGANVNWGKSAYGVTGRTGLKSQRGTAAYGLQKDMWRALSAANNAMASAGLGKFGVTDGWRSYESQVSVKQRKGRLAATPGNSVHGLGYAADLNIKNSKQQRWLEKNGWKYGLGRLPSESWHWQLIDKSKVANMAGTSSNRARRSTRRSPAQTSFIYNRLR